MLTPSAGIDQLCSLTDSEIYDGYTDSYLKRPANRNVGFFQAYLAYLQ